MRSSTFCWHPAGRYRRAKNAAKRGLAAPEQIQGYYAYVQLAFGMGAFVWTIKAF